MSYTLSSLKNILEQGFTRPIYVYSRPLPDKHINLIKGLERAIDTQPEDLPRHHRVSVLTIEEIVDYRTGIDLRNEYESGLVCEVSWS